MPTREEALQKTIDRLALELAETQKELDEARRAAHRWRNVAHLIFDSLTGGRDGHEEGT